MSDPPLMPLAARPLTGRERIGDGDATVEDFWRWAFSDLRMNVDRGVFAEWLVGLALGCVDGVRAAWDEFDLVTASGLRVEVKSAAYLQAWQQARPSRITFSRLSSHAEGPSAPGADRQYRADVYVFALLDTRTHDRLDPLDADQWRFWVATNAAVAATKSRSLSLSGVEGIAGQSVGFRHLAERVQGAVVPPASGDNGT